MDSRLLASYEHGRSQLNYRAAWKILSAFPLNPEWLASGEGFATSGTSLDIPSPEEIGGGPRKLFSEVFDEGLIPRVVPAFIATKANPPPERKTGIRVSIDATGRVQANRLIADLVHRWLERVPDDKLNEFINSLYQHAMNLVESFPPEPESVLVKRLNDMNLARVRYERMLHPWPRAALGTEGAGQAKWVSQEALDKSAPREKLPDVKLSWDQLRERARRLAGAAWGAQSGLARRLGVSRQAVAQWLGGETMPSAEMVLRLLEWVQAEEAKQQEKGPGSVHAPPEPQTRKRSQQNEKHQQSGPPRK